MDSGKAFKIAGKQPDKVWMPHTHTQHCFRQFVLRIFTSGPPVTHVKYADVQMTHQTS